MTKLRTRLILALIPTLALLAPTSAAAADKDGRIDLVESTDGVVSVYYSVPGIGESVNPDMKSVEVTVDGETVNAKAAAVAGGEDDVRRTSVLTIDVSQSMNGPKFEAAQEAALAYINAAPIDLYMGLVTFASDVKTVVEPTQDRAALRAAIEKLTLTRETRLYDGVLEAIEVAGNDGVRSVLLLSDGKDTGGGASLEGVTTAVADSEVRVDAVALDQSADEASALEDIAEASGGEVTTVKDEADLEALFASQAAELSKQVVVTFPHPAGVEGDATLNVSLAAGPDVYVDEALVSLHSDTAASTTPSYEAPGGISLSDTWLLAGVVLLFVGFGALLIIGMLKAGKAELTPMQRQLQLYTVHGMDTFRSARQNLEPGNLKDSAVAVADKFVKGQDFEEKLANKLDRAGFKLTASEWVLLHIGIALVAPLVALLVSGNVIIVLLAFASGIVLPWLFLSFKESRRIKAFNSQLAQTLQIIAGALQAGLSLPQAVDTVVQEGAEPMAGEFRRAIIEQRLGVDIEDTLDTVAERMDSRDFKWVVMAVRIQREVGGNLAELLLTVAATLREREYLRRQVQVLSAEGRMSAWILGGLPPFFLLYLALLRPEYLDPMLHNRLGWIILGVSAVLMAVGAFWLKKMVKVEV
ncbi:MAG: type II secretion system F family protein [Nocardioidaceae bacterium]